MKKIIIAVVLSVIFNSNVWAQQEPKIYLGEDLQESYKKNPNATYQFFNYIPSYNFFNDKKMTDLVSCDLPSESVIQITSKVEKAENLEIFDWHGLLFDLPDEIIAWYKTHPKQQLKKENTSLEVLVKLRKYLYDSEFFSQDQFQKLSEYYSLEEVYQNDTTLFDADALKYKEELYKEITEGDVNLIRSDSLSDSRGRHYISQETFEKLNNEETISEETGLAMSLDVITSSFDPETFLNDNSEVVEHILSLTNLIVGESTLVNLPTYNVQFRIINSQGEAQCDCEPCPLEQKYWMSIGSNAMRKYSNFIALIDPVSNE